MSTRDHCWGVRYDVGQPPTDVDPFNPVAEMDFQMIWCPVLMTDPDGTRWGLFMHLVDASGFGHHQRTVTGAVEHLDGRVERMADIRPDLAYDPYNRRLRGGTVSVTMGDGTERTFELEVPTATGFHLGAGLYFGWQGHHHGEWRGELMSMGNGWRTAAGRRSPASSTSCGTPSSTFVSRSPGPRDGGIVSR